jgi:hypothetical protein
MPFNLKKSTGRALANQLTRAFQASEGIDRRDESIKKRPAV